MNERMYEINIKHSYTNQVSCFYKYSLKLSSHGKESLVALTCLHRLQFRNNRAFDHLSYQTRLNLEL